MGDEVKAIEKRGEVRTAATQWRKKFIQGAHEIGRMYGVPVWWHDDLKIWGHFGKTHGRGQIERDWNAFGQSAQLFRSNIVVEINQPPAGIDHNLQAVFARDGGELWVLHQGRMSVAGSRITEEDFIKASGLQPVDVRFSDGSVVPYHKVARLDAPAKSLQEAMAAWVGHCARARSARLGADPAIVAALAGVQAWEHGLSPEAIGEFAVAGRDPVVGRRRHGEVWRVLTAELERQNVPHSNDRVAQYGPDLFTYGGSRILFEIKTNASAQDIFAGVGQLHIYERLLRHHLKTGAYRKVLAIPQGMREALEAPLRELDVTVLTYQREKGRVTIDAAGLAAVLKG